MSKLTTLFSAVALAVAAVGCQSTAANLQRETARNIGGGVTPEHVTISDVDRSMTSVTWKAATPTAN